MEGCHQDTNKTDKMKDGCHSIVHCTLQPLMMSYRYYWNILWGIQGKIL